jgi:Cu(I)/Ag(I) efflux system periplasmic protein CusF
MKLLTPLITVAFMALAASAALGQSEMPKTEAEIRKIDLAAKKITLKHGPIKNLDMPAMTMVFQVKDAALLEKLAQLSTGDKILFTAEEQQGALVVTGAEKTGTK